MMLSSLLLLLLLQGSAGQTVVVGLGDGQQLLVQNPEFAGFIEGRSGEAVLMYRQANFHGEMPMRTVSRIEFGPYKKGGPFPMTVTLRNGQKLEVQSERRDFVTIRGRTDFGTVMIKHPDPLNEPALLSTKRADRKNDLTILYLEFPGT